MEGVVPNWLNREWEKHSEEVMNKKSNKVMGVSKIKIKHMKSPSFHLRNVRISVDVIAIVGRRITVGLESCDSIIVGDSGSLTLSPQSSSAGLAGPGNISGRFSQRGTVRSTNLEPGIICGRISLTGNS